MTLPQVLAAGATTSNQRGVFAGLCGLTCDSRRLAHLPRAKVCGPGHLQQQSTYNWWGHCRSARCGSTTCFFPFRPSSQIVIGRAMSLMVDTQRRSRLGRDKFGAGVPVPVLSKALTCLLLTLVCLNPSVQVEGAATTGADCGIADMHYFVPIGNDYTEGAVVTSACTSSICDREEFWTPGYDIGLSYHLVRWGLPDRLALVASCTHPSSLKVQMNDNVVEALWYGVTPSA